MVRRLIVFGLVLLGGRITRSMSTNSEIKMVNTKTPDDQQNVHVSTDLEIHNILIEVSNRIFRPDDMILISLIKRGMQEVGKSSRGTSRSSIEAVTKKAQRYVADITSAYTQAIFRASSPEEAEETLQRFQETVERIVDYAKNGQFDS